MALEITVPTAFGTPASYHMISSLQVDRVANTCAVVIASYFDEAARRGGSAALDCMSVYIEAAVYQPEMTISALYDLIKQHPRFCDAVDC